jgi:anti-sigma B factor antagonist
VRAAGGRFSEISVLKSLRKVLAVDSSIQVGVCGPSVWVKVEGKGSFLNSDNLKEFAREMLDQGYHEFVVDLADCAMMDSTFMGTMARLALRLRELGHGHLHIVHCGSRNQQLLSGLGTEYWILMLVAAVRQTVAVFSKPLWRDRLRSGNSRKRRRCCMRMRRFARLRQKICFPTKTFSIS